MGGHIAPVSIVMMVSSFQFRVVEDAFVPRLFSRAGPMFFVNVDHFLCASVYGGGGASPSTKDKHAMSAHISLHSLELHGYHHTTLR